MIGRMIAPSARMMSPAPLPGKKFRKLRFLMTGNSLAALLPQSASLRGETDHIMLSNEDAGFTSRVVAA
jgi:hypothetical protein